MLACLLAKLIAHNGYARKFGQEINTVWMSSLLLELAYQLRAMENFHKSHELNFIYEYCTLEML